MALSPSLEVGTRQSEELCIAEVIGAVTVAGFLKQSG